MPPGSAESPSALLRERGKAFAHLPCVHEGYRSLPYERRRRGDRKARLIVELEGLKAAGDAGLKAHDRWLLARMALMKKLHGRRSSSRLPA
jgi:hypothetical protein